MSEKRATYRGPSATGVDLDVPLTNGETRAVHVDHGAQLPNAIDGVAVPASFRDSLLEQEDNWSEVKQATGSVTKSASSDAKKEA